MAVSLVLLVGLATLSVDPSQPSGSPRTAVQERAEIDNRQFHNPWLAAGLAIAPAIGSNIALRLATSPASPWLGVAMALPAACGLGHLYAGDPLRALAVSTGAPLALAGGMALGGLTSLAMPGPNMGWIYLGGSGTLSAYTVWASRDAYLRAEQRTWSIQ
jgi:hypothetical protein